MKWAGFFHMYQIFEPVREEVSQSGMTEDEVNRFLGELIEEVRQERWLREQQNKKQSR
jgi:hypothetical protein